MTLARTLLFAPLLTFSLGAQGLDTSSGYAVFASTGTGAVQGVPTGTTVGPAGLSLVATDGGPGTGAGARASTEVSLDRSGAPNVLRVQVDEAGSARSRDGSRAAAGTSDDPRTGDAGRHGLRWVIRAPAGATGTVRVNWSGAASAGARTGADVDVDGDGTADFAATVGGGMKRKSASFAVTAGPRGFVLAIGTGGACRTVDDPQQYEGRLVVSFRPDRQPCPLTAFGRPCGGTLTGESASGPSGGLGVSVDLAGASPGSLAVLVIGPALPGPVALPGSRCNLWVRGIASTATMTDANGDAGWRIPFRMPAAGFETSLQALTAAVAPAGLRMATSNGLTMTCP